MDIQEELARYTRAEMDYWDFSGVIRIIQNGSVIFETSRGYANIGFSIKNNIKTIGIDNCTVIHDDIEKALKFLKDKKIKFDLIFLDPPYETDYIKISLAAIEKYNLLATNGLIICESNSKDKIITSKKFLELKEKKYGDKWVVILQQI